MDSQEVHLDASSAPTSASAQSEASMSSGVEHSLESGATLGAQDETESNQLDGHAGTNGQVKKNNEDIATNIAGSVSPDLNSTVSHSNNDHNKVTSREHDGIVKSESGGKTAGQAAQNIVDLTTGNSPSHLGEKNSPQFGESWFHEGGPELDVFGDGSLRMRTLRTGAERDSRPQNGERARFSYRISLAEGEPRTILERRDVMAAIGDADVLFGIETALKFVERGALVRARVASRFAYGVHGLPPAIPPNADLLVEIELHGVDPPVDWRRAHVAARRAFIEAKLSRASFYESLDQHSSAAICISRASSVEVSIAPELEDATKAAKSATGVPNECDDEDEHAEVETHSIITPNDADNDNQLQTQQLEQEPKMNEHATEAASERPVLQRSISDTETRREKSEQKDKSGLRLMMLLSGFVLLAAFATAWFRSRTVATD